MSFFQSVRASSLFLPPNGSALLAPTATNIGASRTSLACLICAEALQGPVGLSCCGQTLCQSCLYRHIHSILEEGISNQGRSKVSCPLGCGVELSDACIRKCLKRAHPQSVWKRCFALVLMTLLRYSGWFRQDNIQQGPYSRTSRYYECWWYLHHSQAERRDLLRYEQWNLAVALRQPQQQDHVVVLHCPAPDCGYVWLGSARYRRKKWQHERKSYYLWYRPPKVEKSNSLTSEQTYDHWAEPEYLNMPHLVLRNDNRRQRRRTNTAQDASFLLPPEREDYDGRRMVCAKCHAVFCGLCRRPWTMRVRRRVSMWRDKEQSHRGMTCASYAPQMIEDDDGYAFVGQLANTRSCPRCSLRTSRIDGCNHMTCPCGKEWCYVCECTWTVRHYACTEQPRGGDTSGCVVS